MIKKGSGEEGNVMEERRATDVQRHVGKDYIRERDNQSSEYGRRKRTKISSEDEVKR